MMSYDATRRHYINPFVFVVSIRIKINGYLYNTLITMIFLARLYGNDFKIKILILRKKMSKAPLISRYSLRNILKNFILVLFYLYF